MESEFGSLEHDKNESNLKRSLKKKRQIPFKSWAQPLAVTINKGLCITIILKCIKLCLTHFQ